MQWKIAYGLLAVLILSSALIVVFPIQAEEPIASDDVVPVPEGTRSLSFSAATVYFQSWLPNVQVVGYRIDADDRVSISLRHVGNGKSPAVTVVVATEGMPIYVPMKGYAEPALNESAESELWVDGGRPVDGYWPPPPYTYPYLIGSGVVKEGWSSPSTVTMTLVGDGSLYDATYIQVLVIPYTGE